MNSLGLSLIFRNGCFCTKQTVYVNETKYYVIERLGEGGFSTVDLVENANTRAKYALKRIVCHSVEDQKIAVQEVEYCKLLKHPNVIQLIDSTFKGTADIVLNATSELFLVLPYFKHGTLHDHLHSQARQGTHLPQREVLRLFAGICAGLQCFHDAVPEPLAHRDLKTGNVCLSDDMSPVIMDLGSTAPARVQVCGSQIAQRIQDMAAERCSMPYRAPELFNVESYCVLDQRTDIWSLGCVLYALCYFKSPFDAVYERGDSVALAVLSGTVHFPETTPYTQELHDLISFMLKVNPIERPYIYSVIEKTEECISKFENKV